MPFVFGCAPVGSYATDGDPDSGLDALRRARDAGLTRFDVAPSYGEAEQLVGRAFGGISVEISTKVGRTQMANANPYARPYGAETARGLGAFDFTAAGVRATLDRSCRRLCVDAVATVFLHDPECDPETARAEALPELRRLREAGRVERIGVATTNCDVALAFAGVPDVSTVMIAAQWSLTVRTARTLLDRCAELGVDVLAAAPFDSGLLASPRPDPAAPSGYRQASPQIVARANALADACERAGTTLPHAALHFPLRHPAVSAVVVGMRTAQEVDANLALMTAAVPDELWAELDRVSRSG